MAHFLCLFQAAVLGFTLIYMYKARLSDPAFHESKFLVMMVCAIASMLCTPPDSHCWQIFNGCIIFVISLALAGLNRFGYFDLTVPQIATVQTTVALYTAMSTVMIVVLPKCLWAFTSQKLSKSAALKQLMAKRQDDDVEDPTVDDDGAELDPEEAGDAVGDLPGGIGARKASTTGRSASVVGSRKMSSARLSSKRGSQASIKSSESGFVPSGNATETMRTLNRKVRCTVASKLGTRFTFHFS
jgi:hypothetical protein